MRRMARNSAIMVRVTGSTSRPSEALLSPKNSLAQTFAPLSRRDWIAFAFRFGHLRAVDVTGKWDLPLGVLIISPSTMPHRSICSGVPPGIPQRRQVVEISVPCGQDTL